MEPPPPPAQDYLNYDPSIPWRLVAAIAGLVAFLIGGSAWALAESPVSEPRERIVIGGLAADQCGATPDAPVIAGDE